MVHSIWLSICRRDGLGEKVWGVPGEPDAVSWQMLHMGLAGSKFKAARPPWAGGENSTGNVYGDSRSHVARPQGGPWPMQDDNFAGQQQGQVRYDHAHAFWDRVMGYGHRENNLRALVIDLLQNWFLQFQDRTNNTHRHEIWMDAYLGPSGGVGDGGASKYKLPVRMDQSLPSDHLATATNNWPAAVSARIGGDMDGGRTWSQMASTGAFLSALHIRPIMDVLWTEAVQPDNTEHLKSRANIEHELIIALLTCGPVGFGDSLPHPGFAGTNVTRLLLASRSDSILLKPAHTALRLDVAPPNPEGAPRPGHTTMEVWAAPAVPARRSEGGYARVDTKGLANAATDRRANSLARLANINGSSSADDRWWYTLLATDVDDESLLSEMLFPVPPKDLSFVVSTFGEACADGAAASSCLKPLAATTPLGITTDPCPGGKSGCRNWKVYGVAPVLSGGWAIVGEESKYVTMSPQRVVAAQASELAKQSDESDALAESELLLLPPASATAAAGGGAAGLSFSVIGAEGEKVVITVLAPAPAAAAAVSDDETTDGMEIGMEGRLAAAMAGKIVRVETTLGASGKADVSCAAGACKVSAAL